jgi:electron transport complex protein RnfA
MSHIIGVENPGQIWDLGRALTLGVFGGLGFTIAIVIMAGIREELDMCDIPEPLKGAAITLIIGGILAMAFMGFTGVDNGIRVALGG